MGVRVEDDMRQGSGLQIVLERREMLEEDTKKIGHVLQGWGPRVTLGTECGSSEEVMHPATGVEDERLRSWSPNTSPG